MICSSLKNRFEHDGKFYGKKFSEASTTPRKISDKFESFICRISFCSRVNFSVTEVCSQAKFSVAEVWNWGKLFLAWSFAWTKWKVKVCDKTIFSNYFSLQSFLYFLRSNFRRNRFDIETNSFTPRDKCSWKYSVVDRQWSLKVGKLEKFVEEIDLLKVQLWDGGISTRPTDTKV